MYLMDLHLASESLLKVVDEFLALRGCSHIGKVSQMDAAEDGELLFQRSFVLCM